MPDGCILNRYWDDRDTPRPEAYIEDVHLADKASDDEYRALAHLRLSALALDKKGYDEALKQVDAIKSPEFAALANDRRGDILLAQGKKAEAIKAFDAAWKALGEQLDYRRVVEAKLTSLGAAPAADKPASGVAQ